MAKYLISRLLLVFLCKYFYNWAFNTKSQLVQFFDISEGFGLTVLSYALTILVLVLGVYLINMLFSMIHLTDEISFVEIVGKIRDKGFVNSLKIFTANFFEILNNNFNAETQIEKYPNLFLVFVFIFLPFSKGNPILNNYYGIYKEYEIENQGRYGEQTDYIVNQNYIVHKSNESEIRDRMNSLEENGDEDEPYFEVKKRGYLFVQAGLIDGYRTYYKEYSGFFSYIECLIFSALEKLINTIMYFFIPFIICISMYHYKFENKKTTTH